MIRRLLVLFVSLFLAAAAYAAVDVNKATQADLESIKGIGPVISNKILDERKKGAFKDWNDMIERVKGVGEKNAARFSAEGLTVNGTPFAGAPAAAAKSTKEPKESKSAKDSSDSKPAKATKTAAKSADAGSADDEKGKGKRARKSDDAASAPAKAASGAKK